MEWKSGFRSPRPTEKVRHGKREPATADQSDVQPQRVDDPPDDRRPRHHRSVGSLQSQEIGKSRSIRKGQRKVKRPERDLPVPTRLATVLRQKPPSLRQKDLFSPAPRQTACRHRPTCSTSCLRSPSQIYQREAEIVIATEHEGGIGSEKCPGP